MRVGYLIVVIVVITAFAASIPVLNATREDFSTLNTDWNGCSQAKDQAARSGYDSKALLSMGDALDHSNATLLLLNPSTTTAITEGDAQDLQRFATEGGTLVLANDFGNGNTVLRGLGLENDVQFDGALLTDKASNQPDAAHPFVKQVVTSSTLTTGVHTLAFNYGTVLDVHSANVTVLARSGPTSTLRGAGAAPGNDTAAARPVLAAVSYGRGTVVVLSDPSVFINDMLGQADNGKLLSNLVLYAGGAPAPVFFDESHRASNPVWALAYHRITADNVAKYVVVLSATSLFVLGLTLASRRHRPRVVERLPVDEGPVIDDLIRAHPGWRGEQVRPLLRQLQRRSK